jgi:hypothetical protein
MKNKLLAILIIIFSASDGCITEFIPETEESSNLLVVEGIITDQFRTNKIRISRALPLGRFVNPKPLKGCKVTITDDNNNSYSLKEYPIGTYSTDSTTFCGHVGGKYTLTILTGGKTYISSQMELLPVPPIDSLYYEKVVFVESDEVGKAEEGCRIFLNTFDPEKKCLFYRWEFIETWEFRIPFPVENNRCWITESSDNINIKNTSIYDQARVTKYPLLLITNVTDRLKERYSILVKQYSLNQDEYNYWEKLQNVTEDVGGLYDITPMAVSSNIHNLNNPAEIILGYFSVSAVTEKRIFINEKFRGIYNLYGNCIEDTIFGGPRVHIEGLNSYVWILVDNSLSFDNPYRVITGNYKCVDCTTRGTLVKPEYWDQ